MAAIVSNGITYGKPNMAAVEGELGRRIMDAIMSTPRPGLTELERKGAEANARIGEAKGNGTL